MKGKFIDLTGQRFGSWAVLDVVSITNSTWTCKCDCGTQRIVSGQALRGGVSNSCGCMRGHKVPAPTITIDDTADDADDRLTTDVDLRIRQLSLVLYSVRAAAERAGIAYAGAIKRMRQAEINMARAVNEKRREQVISG